MIIGFTDSTFHHQPHQSDMSSNQPDTSLSLFDHDPAFPALTHDHPWAHEFICCDLYHEASSSLSSSSSTTNTANGLIRPNTCSDPNCHGSTVRCEDPNCRVASVATCSDPECDAEAQSCSNPQCSQMTRACSDPQCDAGGMQTCSDPTCTSVPGTICSDPQCHLSREECCGDGTACLVNGECQGCSNEELAAWACSTEGAKAIQEYVSWFWEAFLQVKSTY